MNFSRRLTSVFLLCFGLSVVRLVAPALPPDSGPQPQSGRLTSLVLRWTWSPDPDNSEADVVFLTLWSPDADRPIMEWQALGFTEGWNRRKVIDPTAHERAFFAVVALNVRTGMTSLPQLMSNK